MGRSTDHHRPSGASKFPGRGSHPHLFRECQGVVWDMKIRRRALLLGAGALPLLAAKNRWSICSETFAGMDFVSACKAARRTGYSGIEIEPAHLGIDPASLSPMRRKEFRTSMEGEGL